MNPVGTLETAKAVNPLIQLQTFGQSIWLDYIRRDLLKGGELQRLITEDGLRGMTSNPAIFEKAIAGGQYQDFLDSLAGRTDLDAKGATNCWRSATFRTRPTFWLRSIRARKSTTAT